MYRHTCTYEEDILCSEPTTWTDRILLRVIGIPLILDHPLTVFPRDPTLLSHSRFEPTT